MNSKNRILFLFQEQKASERKRRREKNETKTLESRRAFEMKQRKKVEDFIRLINYFSHEQVNLFISCLRLFAVFLLSIKHQGDLKMKFPWLRL
jgi:hypothetical protein